MKKIKWKKLRGEIIEKNRIKEEKKRLI